LRIGNTFRQQRNPRWLQESKSRRRFGRKKKKKKFWGGKETKNERLSVNSHYQKTSVQIIDVVRNGGGSEKKKTFPGREVPEEGGLRGLPLNLCGKQRKWRA